MQTTSRHNGKMWGAIMEAWCKVENSYPLEPACWLKCCYSYEMSFPSMTGTKS